MDGIVNTSVRSGTYVALPDIDSLQEFKVQSQSDKAEFGGVTGGVINMTSKSGTQPVPRLAPSGIFRDERLVRARPLPRRRRRPGRRAARVPPGPVRASTSAGPIVKDKTFFFASYDGWRYRDFADIAAHRSAEGERAERRLLAELPRRDDLQPLHDADRGRQARARPVPRQHHPGEPDLAHDAGVPAGLHACKPNVSGNVAEQLPSSSASRRATPTPSRCGSTTTSRRATTSSSAGPSGASTPSCPRGDVGFLEPDSSNRNFGGGWFHTFSPSMILEVRGGVATQPTEDAPLQHPAGLEPQRGLALPELDRFQGYIVTGLGDARRPENMPDLGVQGPRSAQQPELERGRRPDLAARQAQLQGRLPDAADLPPADEPVRRAHLQHRGDARPATRRHHRRPAGLRAARAARARSAASCPTWASSTSTPRRCRGTSRTSGRSSRT